MAQVKFDGRTKPLAASANTLDGADAFPLPGPNGGILRDLNISLAAGSGPVLGAVMIFRGGSSLDASVIEGEFTLRGSALTGILPDIYVLKREVRYPGASKLRIFLRNDSGSSVTWFARWSTEVT